jgi:hypothetical protein
LEVMGRVRALFAKIDAEKWDEILTKRRVAEVAEEIAEGGFDSDSACSLQTQLLCVSFDGWKSVSERSSSQQGCFAESGSRAARSPRAFGHELDQLLTWGG